MKKSPLDDLKFSVSSSVIGGRFVFPHSFYNKQKFAYTLKSLVSYTKSGNLDFTSVMNLLITGCFKKKYLKAREAQLNELKSWRRYRLTT